MRFFSYICCIVTTLKSKTMFNKILKSIFVATLIAIVLFTIYALVNYQSPSTTLSHSNNDDVTQYLVGKVAAIEEHTQFSFHDDGWSLYGILTIFSTILGAAIAYVTYSAQESVERHTKNVSVSAQVGSLKDLLRHIYRNMVCTGGILLKYREEEISGAKAATSYPSEANMLKLQTQPDIYILPIDIINDDIFQAMTEMKKLMHNYNCEIDIASKHFSTKGMLYESLKQDFNSLQFKPMLLAENSLKLRAQLENSERKGGFMKSIFRKGEIEPQDYVPEFFYTLLKEHIAKLPTKSPQNIETIKNNVAKTNDIFFETICGTAVRNSDLYRGFVRYCNLIPNKEYTSPDGVFTRNAEDEPIMINRIAFLKRYEEMHNALNKSKKWNDKIVMFKDMVEDDEAFSSYFDMLSIPQEDSQIEKNDMCDAFDLLTTILKVDIALEYDNIAMIKFSSAQ